MSGEGERLGATAVVVRRVVGARTTDPELVEDITQETLVRIAGVEDRLDDDSLRAYAIVTARHLLIDHVRAETRHGQQLHRLVEYSSFDGPEEATLRKEETDALAVALSRLDDADRALLLAHEADGTDLSTLAEATGATKGAVAVRLARARAVLRVEFLLAFRRASLPTKRCRAVLLALSAGDTRRQDGLNAGDHLLRCPTCSALSQTLIERRRVIAGWAWLVGGLEAARRFAGRALRRRPVQVSAGVGLAAVATIGVIVLARAPAPSPPPTAAPSTSVAATTTMAVTTLAATPTAVAVGSLAIDGVALPVHPDLGPYEGRAVTATNVPIVAIPADLGFWVAPDDGPPVWIQLTDAVGRPPGTFQVGQRIDLTGTVRKLTADATELGLSGDDATQLATLGLYLEVSHDSVRVR